VPDCRKTAGMCMNEQLIRRIDNVECQSFITLYSEAESLGTGWHTAHGVTSVWSSQDDDPSFSCVLDLARSPHMDETLSHLENVAHSRGARVFGVDTHPDLEDWATEERFQHLGFQPDCEECIWVLDLEEEATPAPRPDGVRVERAGPEDRELFAHVLNTGWDLPENAARGHVFAAGIGLENWYQYLAIVDGHAAGIAVLFVHDDVADCFLSATLPEFRGRGVQTALIEHRLADGRAMGCTLATSQTVVHNASPRNMARRGFQPLYRRWIYGKSLRDR
jgi:GNAT superfamily N-acetyltransferase